MTAANSPDAEAGSWPGADSALAVAGLAMLVLGRAAFQFFSAPLPDEAYYWLWGQRLALSYYDHPPLQAWLQAGSAALFGNTLFGLRAPTLLTTAWTVALLVWWTHRARRLGVAASPTAAVAVFFASPLIFIYSALVFHDHLLIALLGTAAAAFTMALHDAGREGRVNVATLYIAGLATGLAVLTKYNAVLFGLGAALAIVLVPRFRSLLRSPHLYGAAAVALACLAPVLVWNLQNDAASFQYNLVDRFAPRFSMARTSEHVAIFIVLSGLVLSPFVVIALWRFLVDARRAPWMEGWRPLAVSTFAVSTLAFLALSPFTAVFFYWNIPAYLAFLPYASLYMGRSLVRAHLALGMLVAVLYPANYAVLPLAALFGQADSESAMTFGWDEVTERVEEEQVARGAEFLLASDYRIGAILAFHTGDTGVEVISARRNQFDFWFDESARSGQDALILTDDWHPLIDLHRKRFSSIEPVAELPVVRLGRTLKTYTIHIGRGYIPR